MLRASSALFLASLLIGCGAEPRTPDTSKAPPSPSTSPEGPSPEAPHGPAAPDLPQWTPAMHAAARALADADYASGREAIETAMKGTHRAPGAADRDRYRHPAETLDFFGFTP